jgi:hypothetical protein
MLLIIKYDCFILYFVILLPNVLCHMVGRDENGRYLIFAFHVFHESRAGFLVLCQAY